MSYYKAMFRKDNWDQFNPDKRVCEFHDLVFIATNKTDATDHARQVARDRGMVFCNVIGLNKPLGERLLQRGHGRQIQPMAITPAP